MRTIQLSIGEIIEAMCDGLLEAYGDRELALVAAQAVSDELLARVAKAETDDNLDRCGFAGTAVPVRRRRRGN